MKVLNVSQTKAQEIVRRLTSGMNAQELAATLGVLFPAREFNVSDGHHASDDLVVEHLAANDWNE